jgi:hypothetical protein
MIPAAVTIAATNLRIPSLTVSRPSVMPVPQVKTVEERLREAQEELETARVERAEAERAYKKAQEEARKAGEDNIRALGGLIPPYTPATPEERDRAGQASEAAKEALERARQARDDAIENSIKAQAEEIVARKAAQEAKDGETRIGIINNMPEIPVVTNDPLAQIEAVQAREYREAVARAIEAWEQFESEREAEEQAKRDSERAEKEEADAHDAYVGANMPIIGHPKGVKLTDKEREDIEKAEERRDAANEAGEKAEKALDEAEENRRNAEEAKDEAVKAERKAAESLSEEERARISTEEGIKAGILDPDGEVILPEEALLEKERLRMERIVAGLPTPDGEKERIPDESEPAAPLIMPEIPVVTNDPPAQAEKKVEGIRVSDDAFESPPVLTFSIETVQEREYRESVARAIEASEQFESARAAEEQAKLDYERAKKEKADAEEAEALEGHLRARISPPGPLDGDKLTDEEREKMEKAEERRDAANEAGEKAKKALDEAEKNRRNAEKADVEAAEDARKAAESLSEEERARISIEEQIKAGLLTPDGKLIRLPTPDVTLKHFFVDGSAPAKDATNDPPAQAEKKVEVIRISDDAFESPPVLTFPIETVQEREYRESVGHSIEAWEQFESAREAEEQAKRDYERAEKEGADAFDAYVGANMPLIGDPDGVKLTDKEREEIEKAGERRDAANEAREKAKKALDEAEKNRRNAEKAKDEAVKDERKAAESLSEEERARISIEEQIKAGSLTPDGKIIYTPPPGSYEIK